MPRCWRAEEIHLGSSALLHLRSGAPLLSCCPSLPITRLRNFRIVRHVTRTTILVIEDCLRLGKLRVEIVSYRRGEGVRASAEHYLDADVARLLFTDLATGHLAEPYREFKGTVRDGQPQNRIFKISEDRAQNPIKIEIATAPARWWERELSSRPASPV